MSYLEIYNENIRDLLDPASGYLELRDESGGRNIQVKNVLHFKERKFKTLKCIHQLNEYLIRKMCTVCQIILNVSQRQTVLNIPPRLMNMSEAICR